MAPRRRGINATPFGRDYRRPVSWWRRLWSRILDPLFYLRAVIVAASVALLVLPLGADLVNAALKPVNSRQGACRVLSVIDGDTVSLWCEAKGVGRARLTGFDAPELFSPSCLSELVAAQKATWALRLAIFGANRVDVDFKGQDRYRRDLVEMRLDGVPAARQMIAKGHGRTYDGGKRLGWCSGEAGSG
jgi:micrococcal nuclease